MVDYCERGDVSLRARVAVIPVRALRVVISARAARSPARAPMNIKLDVACAGAAVDGTHKVKAQMHARVHTTLNYRGDEMEKGIRGCT